jgi:hypothetical protein
MPSRRRAAALALLPLCLFAVAGSVMDVVGYLLGLNSLDYLSLGHASGSAAADEFRGRVLWAATYAISATLMGWNCVLGGDLIRRYFRTGTRIAIFFMILATVVIMTLSQGYAGGTAQAFVLAANTNESWVLPLVRCANTGAAVTIAIVVFACCALAYHPGTPTASEVRERIFAARVLLYSAAALLIAGVASIFFLFEWPLALPALRTPMIAERAKSLSVTMSVTAGILYTFIMLIIYSPLAVVHERWIGRLLEQEYAANSQLDGPKWLTNAGLAKTPLTMIGEFLAIASPWLAALGLPKVK